MQTTKIFKFSRNVFAAAGVAFISCIIARVQAQDTSTPASPIFATAASAQKADTEWDGVTVELTSVKRDEGGSITVQFKYTNTGPNKAEAQQPHSNLAEWVYYVDPKNKKKYTVIHDSDNNPIVSPGGNFSLAPGASKLFWAKLPAPPADVTSITVFIPGAPPFERVTLAAP